MSSRDFGIILNLMDGPSGKLNTIMSKENVKICLKPKT